MMRPSFELIADQTTNRMQPST